MQHKKRDFDRNARVRKKYADYILPLQVGESVGDCAEKSVSLLGEALEEEKASFVGMAKEALFMTVYFPRYRKYIKAQALHIIRNLLRYIINT